MDLERCGIQKERRFSFFDQVNAVLRWNVSLRVSVSFRALRFLFVLQVHTTGMDIPQGAAARAVLTLGADLIFRDFAQVYHEEKARKQSFSHLSSRVACCNLQAAFRMRGIGKGQRIILFVIPEVERLKSNESARGRGCSASERSLQAGTFQMRAD